MDDEAANAILRSLPTILDPEEEAEKNRILSTLEPGFFEADFDPVLEVLKGMSAGADERPPSPGGAAQL